MEQMKEAEVVGVREEDALFWKGKAERKRRRIPDKGQHAAIYKNHVVKVFLWSMLKTFSSSFPWWSSG